MALIFAVWVIACIAAVKTGDAIAIGVALGWPAAYGLSLWWPEFDCPTCSGRARTRMPWLLRMLGLEGYRRGCRSRWCHDGRRVRLGVRVLRSDTARQLRGR